MIFFYWTDFILLEFTKILLWGYNCWKNLKVCSTIDHVYWLLSFQFLLIETYTLVGMGYREEASIRYQTGSEHWRGIPGRTNYWSQCLFASTYPKGKAVALLVCSWRCWSFFIPGHLWKCSCWRRWWSIWRCIPQGKEMEAMMSVWWWVCIMSF